MSTCACGRPVDDAPNCSGCANTLAVNLGDVPALMTQHQFVLTKATRYSTGPGRVAGTSEAPLPLDLRASEAHTQLHRVLQGWVRLCSEEHWNDARPWPKDDPSSLAGWLLSEVEWIRHHPAGHEACDEIAEATARIRRMQDRPADRWYAGRCDDCQTDMYAREGRNRVGCPNVACDRSYDVTERREQLALALEDMLANAVTASRALTMLGYPVKADRVRKWAERGRILAHGVDAQGNPSYRFGEVRSLAAAAIPRREVA